MKHDWNKPKLRRCGLSPKCLKMSTSRHPRINKNSTKMPEENYKISIKLDYMAPTCTELGKAQLLLIVFFALLQTLVSNKCQSWH